MIQVRNLNRRFGDTCVLDNINLTIEDGDIYGLVGVSGAGKSTLLRCLNGLVPYTEGSVKIDGQEVNTLSGNDLRQLQKNMAMIFQNFSLMSRKTVYENIAFPMRCWKYPTGEIDRTVRELAETVGIEGKLKEKPASLSGGQKQRVAIARALAMNPKILLSDESTSALDPGTTGSILSLLKEINHERNITMVIVSHQMSVIRAVCNNAAFLENGCITASGPVKELFFKAPKNLEVFLGESNVSLPGDYVIKCMLPAKDEADFFLSRMCRSLDLDFKIAYAQTDSYRDGSDSIFTIGVPLERKTEVQDYLNQHEVEWTDEFSNDSGAVTA